MFQFQRGIPGGVVNIVILAWANFEVEPAAQKPGENLSVSVLEVFAVEIFVLGIFVLEFLLGIGEFLVFGFLRGF